MERKKYRFRTTMAKKLVLQIKEVKGPYAGPEIEDPTYTIDVWRDAKVEDIEMNSLFAQIEEETK